MENKPITEEEKVRLQRTIMNLFGMNMEEWERFQQEIKQLEEARKIANEIFYGKR